MIAHTFYTIFPKTCKKISGPLKTAGFQVVYTTFSTFLTLTTFLSRPFLSKLTTPSTFANRVSSPPIPTFKPGWILVPRWRTNILPARTNWPSALFTPSILGCESRPFLELPTPFLCAKVNHLSSNTCVYQRPIMLQSFQQLPG